MSVESRRIRVGTFLSTEAVGMSEAVRRLPGGAVPTADRARCLELLGGVDGVDFVHDLNIDRGHIHDGRVYVGDFCLNDLDLYVWYAQIDRGPYSYHIEALRTLARDTRVVIDPEGFAVGVDKYRSHLALRRAGVRVPDTVLVHQGNVAAAEPVLADWGRAVLKPRYGYFGQGVLLVEDYPSLRDTAGYLASTAPGISDTTLLLERFYENDITDWLSTTFVNGSLMYGYRKAPTRWADMGGGAVKIYDAFGAGGEAELCHVPTPHAEQALLAQKALGARIIGFDMILHDGSPIIVDENTFPGLYPHLFHAVGKDFGRELFHLIVQEIRELRFR
ncbi:RimK family alpha-L-glutamate ligase [Streptomyces sp. CG1]|uniref:ATP-grasp domain-containing protein n=1 Tax=Streptomyces sp. CG1 TaxID=1287523 RepID=UPI0034E2E0EE